MSKKKKFQIEFPLKSSPGILYNYLTTPSGLSEWFADDVNIKNKKLYTFIWEGSEQSAELIKNIPQKGIRFSWTDEPEDEYFEFEISQDELTGDVALVITDFALENEIEEATQLWEAQVQTLKTAIGS
jgi:uncharacterized protein YndB with AHSA1/START domain